MLTECDKDGNDKSSDSTTVTTTATTAVTAATAAETKAAEAGSVVVENNNNNNSNNNNNNNNNDIAPPPYSPKRPPPPYILQNTLNENRQETNNTNTTGASGTTGGRAVPTPFTPFSTGTTATVYPSQSTQQLTMLNCGGGATGGGINPSSEPSNMPPLHCYRPKKAITAEPYDEYCPKCQCRCRTKQKYISGRLTWLLAFIILLLFFPLAFLPFLIKSCKDVHHFCPKCSMLLSIKRRFFF